MKTVLENHNKSFAGKTWNASRTAGCAAASESGIDLAACCVRMPVPPQTRCTLLIRIVTLFHEMKARKNSRACPDINCNISNKPACGEKTLQVC
jgi:hypothetical protein